MSSHRVQRFAVAGSSFILAAGLTRALWAPIFNRSPFALFFAASAVTAWFGGFWLGFGVALLGALTVSVLIGDPGPQVLAAALVTIGVATLISYLAERSRDTESQLEEANGLLNTVLDEAPVGIALFDRNLRYMRVNDVLVRMNGVRADAHIGRTVGEVLPQVDVAGINAAFEEVLVTGTSVLREVAGETRAVPGTRRYWAIYAYPLRLRGDIVGVGTVCEDVTDKKKAQEELRRAKDEAEAANEAKDHFLAKLSHELRTPLTPVLAIASVLESEDRIPGYARQHLSMIRRNVELEARLIDDLLDLTSISRGKVELQRARTDARSLIEEALRTCCQDDIDSGRIHVATRLDATSHDVDADASRLLQVFWNLFNNAMKFTPDGGKVEVSSRVEDAHLVVTVTDSGLGIESERIARIFDAFDQGDPAVTARFGRLGLGLAISRAVISLHGGTIEAASAGRDRGATFTVRLPLLTLPNADAITSSGEDEPPVVGEGARAPGRAATTVAASAPIRSAADVGSSGVPPADAKPTGMSAAEARPSGVSPADATPTGKSADNPPSNGFGDVAGDRAGDASRGIGDFRRAGARETSTAGSAGSRRQPDDPGAPSRPLRILLVEDHADTAEAMTDLLAGLGYQVTRAGTLGEALAVAEGLVGPQGQAPVDLVISDLGLPDGNGQDLMRELVRRYQLKGIALSGYGMDEDRQKSLQAGFARHLTKPVHWRSLQDAIIQVAAPAASLAAAPAAGTAPSRV